MLADQAVRASGGESVLGRLAFLNSTFWYGWAVLAIPLTLLCRRMRIDRSPRIAVPVQALAIVSAAAVHLALQTASQVVILRHALAIERPEAVTGYDWIGEFQRVFPIQLTGLIDWELVTGAGIVCLIHAVFYYRETQQRALREAQLETRLVEAQLQTLQHQLHPHFLFNTLHAISTLMHRDLSAAERMLVQLGDLLRLTLESSTRPEIRLAEEIEFLEKYVQIEQVRLGERLTTIVRHRNRGARRRRADAHSSAARRERDRARHRAAGPRPAASRCPRNGSDDMLVMTVEDTGPGPSERAMAALSTGIGLSNTRARLTYQFGAHYRFEFQRQPGGFAVLVAVPYRRELSAAAAAYVA